MKARFIQEVGTRATLRCYWGDDCPSSYGGGRRGTHNAEVPLRDSAKLEDWDGFGDVADYPAGRWPTKCGHCDAGVPAEATRQVFTRRLYDTPSGNPEPGDIYFVTYEHWEAPYSQREGKDCTPTTCTAGWSNCDGKHLHAVTPNGQHWNIDGRASNCTMREDQTHRCWVRRGDPAKGEPVHVDKGGNTCAAGAGSIVVDGWHGFLHNGEFRSC